MPKNEAPTILFFCGHRSTFGLQALAAVLDSRLCPDYILLAKAGRWQQFDRQLNPDKALDFRQRLRDRLVAIRQGWRFFRIWWRRPVRIKWISDVHEADFVSWLGRQSSPMGIVAAFPQLFRPVVLDPFQGSVYNLHPSDLPNFAGAHPHFWAVRTGARQLGLTAHQMTQQIDEGPIWAQVCFPIEGLRYSEVYAEIGRQLPDLVGALAHQVLDLGKPLALNFRVTHRFRNNPLEASRIRWAEQETEEILQIIRTETAFCYLGEQNIRIWEAIPEALPTDQPGRIAQISAAGISVHCLDGGLLLLRFKQGRRVQTARAFALQKRLMAGQFFS